ncbi:LysR family transcriptional regulator (plasmid) [Azospirillum baldaniorum]|uniref:Transcriptional regulatory protein,LysR family n=1 Tax=Azospirillum baldaniorum TaxID=1064539 RepID=A0A9P1NPN1_9PROT|nr:LysR family transcriptional regulator [Azospirillum baldaniorum]AWJ91121.1 LysR family transcriptional regulator [Azospirillum baldaniorum]TWA84044.1 LysR family transcriptional regulator [Azospirillum brasilense]CCD01152.1 putative transcriptional regulatory protein,LysR family [Azospirillum baldaniorum]
MDDTDLRDLQAFAAVARHRSFRRAALEQRVSVSSLSQRMRELEEHLGVRLLNRTTRSVAPTEAGEQLLRRLEPALGEVAGALSDLRERQGRPAGRLRINAPAPAVDLVLAPMVTPFLTRFPDVELEITVDIALIDIVAQGYDAGVRYEEHLAQDMVAVPLGPPQRFVLCAAPSVLDRFGVPERPEDLLGKPSVSTVYASGAHPPWEFEKDGRIVRIQPGGPFHAGHTGIQLRAALDGLGFLMTFDEYVREHIAAGRLVAVLEDWSQSFPGPFLYYPSRRQPPASLRAFLDFLKDWRRQAATP